MSRSVKLVTELDGYDIAHQLSCGDALQLIKDVDLGIADAEFTENLIKMLCNSLKNEYTVSEYKQLIEEIS